jgi:uncharacterized protein (UPF0303 family)
VPTENDIERIADQEGRLIFDRFDEDVALAIGLDIRARVAAMGGAAAIDIRLWDRRLFWSAMPGTSADNEDWVERKSNAVRRFHKSTYRMVLERGGERLLPERYGAEAVASCILAGGSFPVKVRGVGCIGSVTVSGLREREDHEVVVAAICTAIGGEAGDLGLAKAG